MHYNALNIFTMRHRHGHDTCTAVTRHEFILTYVMYGTYETLTPQTSVQFYKLIFHKTVTLMLNASSFPY